MSALDLLAIGECMVELSRQADGRLSMAYGGDSFNTAAYASRLGLVAGYGTALGDDPYSDGILGLAETEAVDMSAVPRLAGRVPGLYLIETDPSGERRFFYWRDAAPARQLFELEASQGLVERMAMARIVYFSGITLSLYSQPGLDRFEEALVRARAAGARIAFDGNFRPRGWGGDHHRARAVMSRFLRQVEIALPTFEDEAALWGDASPEATIARLQAEGVSEIVIKNGPSGAIIACGNQTDRVAVPQQVEAVDTTAAGDSFNAGYFAGRLAGQEPAEAAMLGHRLAAIVIRHRGAIVPRASTSGLLPVN